MPTSLPGKAISSTTASISKTSNPLIDSVVKTFKELPSKAQYFDIDTVGLFKNTEAYQGINRRRTHYQGVLRTRDGKHLIVSGGDRKSKHAQLFILKFRSHIENVPVSLKDRIAKEPFGSNVQDGNLPIVDSLIEVYKFPKSDAWHSGGIDLCGDILAIPIEDSNSNSSSIKFLNVGCNKNGTLIPKEIKLKSPIVRDKFKAGATFLVRFPNNHYLCGVWSDSDKEKKKTKAESRKLDLYYSKSKDIRDGFGDAVHWNYSFALDNHAPKFQTIQAFIEAKTHKIFLIGTENKSAGAPIIPGENRAFLYEMKFKGQKTSFSLFKLTLPKISLIHKKVFAQALSQYNFDGAAGIYATPQNKLALYSAYHWNVDNRVKLGEFYSAPVLSKNISSIHEAFTELYTKHDFQGRCLKIFGLRNSRITDYSKIKVQHTGFKVKVKSYKFRIPQGKTYRLYKKPSFNDPVLDLIGNGRLKRINQDIGWVSSSDFL